MRDSVTSLQATFLPAIRKAPKVVRSFVTFSVTSARLSPSIIEMSTSSLFFVLMIGSAVAVVEEDATEEWGSACVGALYVENLCRGERDGGELCVRI